MGQATVDLPDPLQNANPTKAQSADDLLSQLAGDEIDRLLAESGDSPEPSASAVSAGETGSLSTPVVAEPAVDLDSVLDTAIAERAALHADTVVPPAAQNHSPSIELGDPQRRLPLFLRPLEWLSSPLDPWPDQMREILGKIGLMTFINALAVLAYVVYRRHHH